jgi:hypothetical protein
MMPCYLFPESLALQAADDRHHPSQGMITQRVEQAGFTIEGASIAGWRLRFAPFIETYGDYFRAHDLIFIGKGAS